MELSSLLLIVLNFIFIAILPIIFFRGDGKLTLMWFFTALPYVVAPILSISLYMKVLPLPISEFFLEYKIFSSVGVLLCVFSIMTIAMTIGSHRIPLALWHQKTENDEPKCIVTWGTYKYIRHPFYSAFILAHVANCLIAPFWGNIAILIYTCLVLNYTAAKEERRLCSEPGDFGLVYSRYKEHTGRFIPRLRVSSSKQKMTSA